MSSESFYRLPQHLGHYTSPKKISFCLCCQVAGRGTKTEFLIQFHQSNMVTTLLAYAWNHVIMRLPSPPHPFLSRPYTHTHAHAHPYGYRQNSHNRRINLVPFKSHLRSNLFIHLSSCLCITNLFLQMKDVLQFCTAFVRLRFCHQKLVVCVWFRQQKPYTHS